MYLISIYKKNSRKTKNIINKCDSSTISVQNGVKTPVKELFTQKYNLLIVLTYLGTNSQ